MRGTELTLYGRPPMAAAHVEFCARDIQLQGYRESFHAATVSGRKEIASVPAGDKLKVILYDKGQAVASRGVTWR
jgi:hypothetical protein